MDMTIFQRMIHGKVAIALTSVLILYTLSGFFLAPYLVKRFAPDMAAEKLHRELRLGAVKMNPFLFSFQADDVGLYEVDGTLIAGVKQCFMDFELSSLFRWALVFKTIRLDGPRANVIIDEEGVLNFARMGPEKHEADTSDKDKAKGTEETAPIRLVMKNVQIIEGEIDYADQRQSVPATITIRPLNLELHNISTLPDREGPYSLAATTPEGESFQWTGEITLHPFRSRGRLGFNHINLASVWQFFRDSMAIDNPDGQFDFNTAYEIDLGPTEPIIRLNNLEFNLAELAMQLPGDASPLLELSRLDIKAPLVDVTNQTVDVRSILFEGGKTGVFFDGNGRLNWSRFATESKADDAGSAPETSGQGKGVPQGQPAPPWEIKVSDVELRDIQLQYQDQSREPMLQAGVADIDAAFQLALATGQAGTDLQVTEVAIDLNDIQIGNPDTPDPEISLEKWLLKGGSYDLGRNSLEIESIYFQNGNVDVRREKDGHLNLAGLFLPDNTKTEKKQEPTGDAGGSLFQYLIKSVALEKFGVMFSDQTVAEKGALVHLDNLHIAASNVDGKSQMPMDLSFDIREGGRVETQGRFDPVEPSLKADIDISALALSPFEPYLRSQASLKIASGTLSTQGQFVYRAKEIQPKILYKGGFDVADLQILEPGSKETLVGWKHFMTSDLIFQLQQDRLEISELKLSGLDGQFIIFEDGSLNLAHAFKREEVEPPKKDIEDDPKSEGPVFPVYIHKLQVEDSGLLFADYSLPSKFTVKIHQLDGSIIGMSSEPGARARVKLDGRVNDYGMSKIKGDISVFDPAAYLDMSVLFRNLEMNRLTPYSGKFVGRRIDSGKLSLDLKYFIESSKLKGDNQIIVERIQLGEQIDSPGAISLPLNLAIAILQDANGVIDVALPVSGDLEDPKFSYGQIVWKAFTNLIVKIAASPFRALGALLGVDAEKLDVIDFENGSAELMPPEVEKLANLANALEKRPNLKLLVQGRYSEKKDGKVLKALQLKRFIAERQGRTLAPGDSPDALDFGNVDTRSVLETVFAERYGKGTLDEIKVAAEQASVEDQEKTESSNQEAKIQDPAALWKKLYRRMVDDEPLEESALIQLGESRSQVIVRELLEGMGVSEDRVAVKKPKALKPGRKARAKLTLEVLQANQAKSSSP
jgi:uncharacterized protein involved in outer membrane biogenesis